MKPTSFKNIEELRNFLRSGWSRDPDPARKPLDVSHETEVGDEKFPIPKFGSTYYIKPHQLDFDRTRAIMRNGAANMYRLAEQQAGRIRNPEKALRRAWAALEMTPRSEYISSAFYKRYLVLLGSS